MILNFKDFLNEKLMLKDQNLFAKIVADEYDKLPDYDENVIKHQKALNESNHKLFKRLISKANVIFVTKDKQDEYENIHIDGKDYPLMYQEGGQPYENAEEMKQKYEESGDLYISIDYSNHPIFSVIDNIVFRSVHDYLIHILGDYAFGLVGEIACYNLHVKMTTKEAVPALFVEVLMQACYAVVRGDFPDKQKVALPTIFDYYDVGKVDGYYIDNKILKK